MYIGYITYFNKTIIVTNLTRAYNTTHILCPKTRLFYVLFKWYKYKELAFNILFLLSILNIFSLNIITFIFTFIRRFILNIYSPLYYYYLASEFKALVG